MSEPVWILKAARLRLHDAQLAEHGGIRGVNDDLLESALSRARQKFYYSDTTLPILAATYGYDIARNHPFKDGNKRATLIAIRLFLITNGYDIAATREEKYLTIMQLAGGEMSEDQLGEWISAHVVPRV